MQLTNIPLENFSIRPMHLWDGQAMLLTSGDFEKAHYNTMTVGWGSIGYIWRKPFVQVVVRPVRYTYQFMQQYDTFTLSAFPHEYSRALDLLGTRSGRDGDKIKDSGLHPIASTQVAAPSFAEAELVLECRKVYWDDFDPTHFIDPGIGAHYPTRDYHRVYFGEILQIRGTEKFIA